MRDRPTHLSRRQFLQAIVVTAGAVQACSSDVDVPPPPIDGRTFENGEAYFPQSIASGDPKPNSVILWTRVFDEANTSAETYVSLEVFDDDQLKNRIVSMPNLQTTTAHDNAIKVKVVGLSPRTQYFYRFIYEREGKNYASKVGRTKTAPAETDGAIVKFAVTTCQDFAGRYYNSWQRMAQLDADLDFVIFLGDYIYETVGAETIRPVSFGDPADALPLKDGSAAAQSVGNYRDLYKTVRSDPFLRAIHERYPFVFVWDDHEYSDDCWGATSTYTSGIADTPNVERRQHAEQAYFEYVPFDDPNTTSGRIDVGALPNYPDTRIYRDLAFGRHLRLLVADTRTYRPDHLIPEDAFPATVVMTEADVAAFNLTEAFASDTFAYIDISDPAYGGANLLLKLAYQSLAVAAGVDDQTAAARAEKAVKGPLALAYINAVLTGAPFKMAPIPTDGKPRGLAYVHMGKRDLFSIQGARYVVVRDTFDIYAAFRNAATMGESDNVLGAPQEAWLDAALAKSETWKVLVSSVSLTTMTFDLTLKMDIPEESLRNRYYLNADQWDGFPNRKRALLGKLAGVSNNKAFAVSGDIHGSFASIEEGVACLTTPAISSNSVKSGASDIALASGFKKTDAIYRYLVTELDDTFREGNPKITFTDTDSHGFLVVELGSDEATATFHLIASTEVATNYGDKPDELAGAFRQLSVKVKPGSIDLA